jgi:hypothetical protein
MYEIIAAQGKHANQSYDSYIYRYAQCRADRVVATTLGNICLPHIPSRYQSKQKSQPLPPRLRIKVTSKHKRFNNSDN